MPNHRALLWSVPLAAIVLALGPSAAGQPAADRGEPPRLISTPSERADELHLQAKPLMDTQRWSEALVLLEEAYGLKQSYDIATNFGATLLALNRPREAAEAFATAWKNAPSDLDDERRARLTNLDEQARAMIAVVRVEVPGSGATVLVDGKAVGTSPLAGEVFLDAGEHRFEAEKAGARSAAVVRALGAGTSEVVVLGEVGAAGDAEPNESRGGAEPWVLGLGYGVAGLALVGGFVFVGLANGKGSDAEAELARLERDRSAPCCEELGAIRDEQNTFANAAVWSFVGAGAFAVGTTVYWLIAESGEARSAILGPRPWIGAEGAGLGWSGRW